jgi:ABC-type branched-subunit amino acid transport system permease subunit
MNNRAYLAFAWLTGSAVAILVYLSLPAGRIGGVWTALITIAAGVLTRICLDIMRAAWQRATAKDREESK